MIKVLIISGCLIATAHIAYADDIEAPPATPFKYPYSLPVRITEQAPIGPEEAASRKGDEARQVENLLAQQAMVRETHEIVVLSRWQLVLAVVGTAALVFTLRLNSAAVSEASRANTTTANLLAHEQKKSEIELRAYLGIKSVSLDVDKLLSSAEDVNIMNVAFENFGQTPARDVRLFGYVGFGLASQRLSETGFDNVSDDLLNLGSIARPSYSKFYQSSGQVIDTAVAITQPIKLAADRDTLSIYLYGRVYYRDCYDNSWRITYCYVREPRSSEFMVYEIYNDEEKAEHIDDFAWTNVQT